MLDWFNKRPITGEELFAIPGNEDGLKIRYLLRGKIEEKPWNPVEGTWLSDLIVNLSIIFYAWIDARHDSSGTLFSHHFVRLRRSPDTMFASDLVFYSQKVAITEIDCKGWNEFGEFTTKARILEGVPTLAIEIPKPADTFEEIHERIGEYLEAGVRQVWVLNFRYSFITVFETGKDPKLITGQDEIAAEPWLPGFRVSVDRIFGGRFQKRRP